MEKLVSKLEVHETMPQGFEPQVQVAACYLEIDNRLLLLQRPNGKFDPEKWGVPAGKLENTETPENAAKRELWEETGISSTQIESLGSLYIRKPGIDYIYHLFKVQIDHMPQVRLSDEHQSYTWATSKDIEKITLMDGAREALQYYQAIIVKKRSE